jgi:hypothetical protein
VVRSEGACSSAVIAASGDTNRKDYPSKADLGIDLSAPLDTSALDDLYAELKCRECGWPHITQGCMDETGMPVDHLYGEETP